MTTLSTSTQNLQTVNLSSFIDESVVTSQKKKTVEMIEAQKRLALEQAQKMYEVSKSQIVFDSEHKMEMTKQAVEAKRIHEIMQLEQHFAQEKLDLEQSVQHQKISIEQQALQLEQQARQQAMAKLQYEQMVKLQQNAPAGLQLPQYQGFSYGNQSFVVPNPGYSYVPQQQLYQSQQFTSAGNVIISQPQVVSASMQQQYH